MATKISGFGERNGNQEPDGQAWLDFKILGHIRSSHMKKNEHFPATASRILGKILFHKYAIRR
jgi:hypothetical protein